VSYRSWKYLYRYAGSGDKILIFNGGLATDQHKGAVGGREGGGDGSRERGMISTNVLCMRQWRRPCPFANH